MSHIDIKLAILVVWLLPLAWTALFSGLQRLMKSSTQWADDKAEKLNLLFLTAPVVAGIVFVILGPLAPVSLPLPVLDIAEFGGDVAVMAAQPADAAHPTVDWFRVAAMVGLMMYGAVAAFQALRLGLAQLHLARLVAQAIRDEGVGRGVRLTTFAAPPLAWGRRTVLLPSSLVAAFNELQIALIVRHEHEHLRRGDGHWFAILAWVDVVFWFNPFVRAQTRRCRLAAELACDAAVLRATPDMRGIYAQTLVKTLKHTAGNALPISTQSGVPAVFTSDKSGDYRMRISEIMHPPAARRKPSRGWLYAMAAALAIPLALAQFAWSQGTRVGATPDVAAVAAASPSILAVVPIKATISSGFGDRINPVTHKQAFHPGVDYAAPIGTPVVSASDGTVSTVYYEKWHMGHVVEIDHGGGLKTRYTHLDAATVKTGDHVTAGQQIATSGNSGVTTGPHMHFEVWQNGEPIDPVKALPTGQ